MTKPKLTRVNTPSIFLTTKSYVMEAMTKAQLQAVCNQKDIPFKKSEKKEDLIKRINEGEKIIEQAFAKTEKIPFVGEY